MFSFFKKKQAPAEENKPFVVKAYLSGKVVPIEEVKDEVFSSKALGDGLAIEPEENVIVAPCDATVSVLMEGSRHAVGLTLANGVEILIHEGIDTVNMEGDGFEYFVKEGDKVLVVGAGTIGVLAAIAAKAKGASVYISDVSAGKLEMAKDFGVDGTLLNDSPENFEKRVNEITDGNGFDVTIEAVGLPSTFQNCIDACCFGGRMVLIGVGKKNLDFNFTLIQKKELNVYGSRNALKKDFLELIDIVNAGKAPLHKIITNTYAFDDAAKAFDDFAHNPGNMLKVVFDFSKISK